MQNGHFTPPELARRLGVNESTIKRWIDKGMLASDRTSGGHRRVSEKHLATFIQENPKLGKKSYHIKRWQECVECDWKAYYDLQFNSSHNEAREYLHTRFVALGDVLVVMENIVLPTLREIGSAWRDGKIDIADEHRMSFCIRSDLLTLQSMLPNTKKNAPAVLLACTPGENHELSLVLLSLVARAHGWQSIVLGINVPLEQVEASACKLSVKAVVLAKIYTKGKSLVQDVHALARNGIRTYIGGPGWSERERVAFVKGGLVQELPNFRDFVSVLVGKQSTRISRTV